MKILSLGELKSVKGIRFSRQHIDRLIKSGDFPRPIKLGGNTNGWIESEIDAYLTSKLKKRDEAVAAQAA